jgi:hypothetical protein
MLKDQSVANIDQNPTGTVGEFVAVKASKLHTFQHTSTIIGFRVAESKGLLKGRPPDPGPDSSSD